MLNKVGKFELQFSYQILNYIHFQHAQSLTNRDMSCSFYLPAAASLTTHVICQTDDGYSCNWAKVADRGKEPVAPHSIQLDKHPG